MLCVVGVLVIGAAAIGAEEEKAEKPRIQVAILLDNSGSLGGLINQAKAQLWAFVNEFATTKKNGRIPIVEVGLYIYGNPPPKQIVPLTNNLDLVSEKLFAVRISGGSEYCGQVIQTAVNDLAWSDDKGDLKVIFIAGNEPFTQGPVNYAEACKAAITKGIIVNTIHCGSESAGISGKWKDGAMLADGSYLCINQNNALPAIEAPQDKEIAKLSAKLNTTYVAYGAEGKEGAARQEAQDKNAATLAPGVAAQRALAKANVQYRNAAWDLVDAVEQGEVKLDDIKEEDLPENMREMSPDERKAYIEKQAAERKRIQRRINKLNDARTKYVAEERKKLAEKQGDRDLGAAMLEAIRKQAAEREFVNEK
jgi:hypothetical protein